MPANGIEKQRETAVPAPSLPHLKVLRETWCTQAQADAATDILQEHNPELIADILREERASRAHDYFSVMAEAVDYLDTMGAPVPETLLGKLDLAVEISRRVRKANGMQEFKVRGKALPQPLPPLPGLPVSEGSKNRGKLTQEITDRILENSYKAEPDLWIAASEEYRHETCVYAADALRASLRSAVDADFGPTKNDWTAGEMFIEAARRIYSLCGIAE